jgi:hypothetical protein
MRAPRGSRPALDPSLGSRPGVSADRRQPSQPRRIVAVSPSPKKLLRVDTSGFLNLNEDPRELAFPLDHLVAAREDRRSHRAIMRLYVAGAV